MYKRLFQFLVLRR